MRGRFVSGSALVAAAALFLSSAACTIETHMGGPVEPVNWHSGSGGGGGTTVVSTNGTPAPAPMPNVPAPTATQTPTPGPGPRRIVQIPKPNPSGGGTKFIPVPVARSTGLFGGPNPNGALKGLVYFIPESTMSFPDVSNMSPSALVYTDTLDISAQDFTQGIGGTNRLEFYAIQYDGTFTASKGGTYTFWLESSDGSKLIIDGKIVVDNDQRHTPLRKANTVDLAAGSHTIRVDFFKAYRWVVALRLTVAVPGGTERVWTPTL